jgi:hypothetical protein
VSLTEASLDAEKQDPPFDIGSCLSTVSRTAGKKPGSQAMDIAKLTFGFGKLTAREYFAFRLFDDEGYSFEDKQRFIGQRAQNRILTRAVPVEWWSVAHDKLVFYGLAEGLGFRVPKLRALYHPYRCFGQVPVLGDRTMLEEFLRDETNYPFFGKPLNGMFSVAVSSAIRYEAAGDRILLSERGWVAVEDFAAQLDPYLKNGYLLQERLMPHERLREVCGDHLSTIRMVLLIEDKGPTLLHCLWKIPAGDNIADNFWRPGNLLASIDAESGQIARVIQGTGLDQVVCKTHPDSGRPLLGMTLPQWPDLKAYCLAGAASLPGLSMQAWDIALCPEGPVMVEVNIGGDFNLPQLATGRGLLEGAFADFLDRRGLGPKRSRSAG